MLVRYCDDDDDDDDNNNNDDGDDDDDNNNDDDDDGEMNYVNDDNLEQYLYLISIYTIYIINIIIIILLNIYICRYNWRIFRGRRKNNGRGGLLVTNSIQID